MYTFQEMDTSSAQEMLKWSYPDKYAIYNVHSDQNKIEDEIAFFIDPANQYYSIKDENGVMVAYCCFGEDARVPGGDYSIDALDVGAGTHPDLTGQGNGHLLLGAILDFGRKTLQPTHFRATVAAVNSRAQRACEKAGYHRVDEFTRESDGREFYILLQDA
jgi:[ribosomal protein S18]-alanine N-acetyltransferase